MNRRQILGLLGVGGASLWQKKTYASSFSMQKEESSEPDFSTTDFLVIDSFTETAIQDQFQAGMVIHTLGYYERGDGGGATYKLLPFEENEKIQIGEWEVGRNLKAQLVGVQEVNYKMFGAKGDGKNDDGLQIKAAHDYANKYKLTVVNRQGVFWLISSQTIEICTNVVWGTTAFHILESENTRNKSRFLVKSVHKPKEIAWDEKTKKEFLDVMKPGVQQFLPFTPYRNSFIVVKDENDRIGYRAGARYGGKSWAKEEFFYVEEHGRIMGDIAWAFNDYTHLTAYPAEESYLVIEGGTFYLSGEGAQQGVKGYRQNGFSITRSRTIIRNQWVGLEAGAEDTAMSPRTGFYNFNYVYDVTLENVRLIPWEQDREGTERDVPAGTYGISGSRVMKSYFHNVLAEGGPVHWGVFGTNLIKDLCIDRCHLNRIDVHFHAWNIHVRDSKIGFRGISVTGGGQLTIENTESKSRFFVNFRTDYGAKWDGGIYIRNCRFKPPVSPTAAVMYFIPQNVKYGYPIGLAHSIHVENLKIIQPEHSSTPPCWMIYAPPFSKTKEGVRLFFPRDIIMKNIRVEGGRKGVRIMKLKDPEQFFVKDKPGITGIPNSQILLEDIDLEPLDNEKEGQVHTHFQFISEGIASPVGEALYPQLLMSRCNGLTASFDIDKMEVDIKQSLIHQFVFLQKKLTGKILFWNCTFEPRSDLKDPSEVFHLQSSEGTSFFNCRLSAPLENGEPSIKALKLIGFVDLNKSVKHNHLHTSFDRRTLYGIKKAGIRLKREFMQKLIQNYEVDGEQV